MSQKENDNIVKSGMIAALVLSAIYAYTLFHFVAPYDSNITFDDKMILVIKSIILPCFMFLLGIMSLAHGRFGNASDDPTKCECLDQKMKVNIRYLSNTHEQFTLFIVNVLGLAIFLPVSYLTLIPIYSSLFVIGRIVFWVGYRINPLYRATGFGISFYPAILGILYNSYSVLAGLF